MTIYALPMDADSTTQLPAFTGSQNRVADAVLLSGGSAARPLGARSGWRPGAGPQVSISGVTATIQPLAGVIDTVAGDASGPFRFVSDAVVTKTITTALQGATRSDILYAQVSDQPTDSSGLRQGDIAYLAGASGGAVPATPARSLRLGVINVPASGGGTPTFTPDAVYSVAAGGILPVAAGVRPSNPYVGRYIDDATMGLQRYGSAWGSPVKAVVAIAFTDGAAHPIGTSNIAASIGVWANNYISPAGSASGMSIAAGGITVGVGGLYMVSGGLSFDESTNSTGRRGTWPTVNGTGMAAPYRTIVAATPGGTSVPMMAQVLLLGAGDVISATAYQTSGVTINYTTGSLMVSLLGAV